MTSMPIVCLPGQCEFPGACEREGKSQALPDFAELANLSSNWPWSGAAGEIEEDIAPDGTVDLPDFARFTDDWKANP